MAKDDFVYVSVDNILMDSTCQTRPMNGSTVYDYAERMREGIPFPPVVIFEDDDGNLWLADGFHRVAATKEAGLDKVRARVHPGDQRQAILYSLGPANADHGLPLTRADRTKRVERILSDPEWSQWSDRQIAIHCGVSNSTVGIIRSRLADSGVRFEHLKDQNTRKGADGKTYQAPRPKHWSERREYQNLFWGHVNRNHLDQATILEKLQPGAKTLADLNASIEDVEKRLDQIAIEEHSARWKAGDCVRHVSGRYGTVKACKPDYLHVLNLELETEQAWFYRDCQPATREEWEQSKQPPGIGEPPAPQPQPEPEEPAEEEDPIPDLPARQVEFLLALRAGQPVARNAATRLALRRHGLITGDDDWNAIRLTDDGECVADYYSAYTLDDVPETDPNLDDEPAAVDTNTLNLDDFESDGIVEIMPALRRVLAFVEGYDIPVDDALVKEAWAVFRFFDQVTEMVTEASQQEAIR